MSLSFIHKNLVFSVCAFCSSQSWCDSSVVSRSQSWLARINETSLQPLFTTWEESLQRWRVITTALQTVLALLSLWQDPQSCWLSCSWWFLNAPDYIFEDTEVNLSSQINKTISLRHIHTLQVICTEAESKQM